MYLWGDPWRKEEKKCFHADGIALVSHGDKGGSRATNYLGSSFFLQHFGFFLSHSLHRPDQIWRKIRLERFSSTTSSFTQLSAGEEGLKFASVKVNPILIRRGGNIIRRVVRSRRVVQTASARVPSKVLALDSPSRPWPFKGRSIMDLFHGFSPTARRWLVDTTVETRLLLHWSDG